MINIRALRDPSPSAAALVRLAAFVVAVASVVVIVGEFGAVAAGHVSARHAISLVAVAAVLTLATTLAARRLDPLRR